MNCNICLVKAPPQEFTTTPRGHLCIPCYEAAYPLVPAKPVIVVDPLQDSISHWDRRFLELAAHISTWSRDPSTQVGAVIIRSDKTVASVGFNGFPRGIEDDERLQNRELKYEIVVHAELNAILHAREPLHGYTLYVHPMPPCSRCASAIIQSGIQRIVAPSPIERWRESCELGFGLFNEAGITVDWVS